MPRSRMKSKGRKISGSFIAIPHAILESEEYAQLSAHGIKLLLDLFSQFRGTNNGDFSAAWSLMKERGWRSRDTLGRALRELQERGWITKTRQGGRSQCSLYAVTWIAIDECQGKLDVLMTRAPSNLWKQFDKLKVVARLPLQASPSTVPKRGATSPK